MKLESTILRSKVARRVFLLFVACAMLPIIALTMISSRVMTSHLEEQARLRLRQSTKSVGMILLSRLSMVESDLRTLALLADADPGEGERWAAMVTHMQARIQGVARISATGVEAVFGSAPSASMFSHQDASTQQSGAVRVVLLPQEEIRTVLLSLAFEDTSGERNFLVAEIDPDYLWNVDDEIELPSGTEMLVLDSDRRPLFTSLEQPGSPDGELLPRHVGSLHGEFQWSIAGRSHRGHSWSLFLKSQYRSAGWTVVLSEPTLGGIQSLAWASDILPFVILLCLLVVALLSLVQIKKSLIPIVSLQEGTRKIAAGNFDTRVTVVTNDEFSELADSFNAMALRIGTQFNTLSTLADIDRELLSTLREDQIVESLLSRAPERFRCDRAAVTLVGLDEPNNVSTRARLENASTVEGLAILTEQERLQIFADDDAFTVTADALHPHLVDVLGSGLAECLIVPIRRRAITGCLTLGFRRGDCCTQELRTEASRIAGQAGIALSNARLLEQLERVNWETLYALARAVDANSSWTAGHSERVTSLALELARRLDVSQNQLVVLHKGGLLHDVGKIGVPGYILDKPGRLTDEEFDMMRDHVRIGARILEPISAYRNEIPIVRHHHERWDGTGYPDGLAGRDIPFLARVLAVADVFDALVSDRPYRAGWERERVIEFIGSSAGTQFDPEIVPTFLDLMHNDNWQHQPKGAEPCLITNDTVAGQSLRPQRS